MMMVKPLLIDVSVLVIFSSSLLFGISSRCCCNAFSYWPITHQHRHDDTHSLSSRLSGSRALSATKTTKRKDSNFLGRQQIVNCQRKQNTDRIILDEDQQSNNAQPWNGTTVQIINHHVVSSSIDYYSDKIQQETSLDKNEGESGGRRSFLQAGAVVLAAATACLGDTTVIERLLLPANDLDGPLPLSVFSLANAASELKYETSPVNKRFGVTVFDAEKAGYNVQFITYLSRFLLNFDGNCQRWWYARAGDIPRDANSEKVASLRLKQFGAFSASVEVGLQEYEDKNGPVRLMRALLGRYCPNNDDESVSKVRSDSSGNTLIEKQKRRQQQEIDEARRQIALLFGLLESPQPVDEITKVLAAIDNATITNVNLVDGGTGYAPGYGPPNVLFPQPEAGDDFDIATGRAILTPTGRILRIDLPNHGYGYTKPPTVTISPPSGSLSNNNSNNSTISSQKQQLDKSTKTTSKNNNNKSYETATASAVLFKDGNNKGRILRITLDNPGEGYDENEKITIKISPPQLKPEEGGVTAVAKAIREYQVGGIQIVDGGNGYAAEKAIPIYVEPPPLTARIDLNDPILIGMFRDDYNNTNKNKQTSSKQIPMTPEAIAIASFQAASKAEAAASKGGGMSFGLKGSSTSSGVANTCEGRGCYDRKVIAYAYSRPEKQDSYTSVRDEEVSRKMQNVELAVEERSSVTVGGSTLLDTASTSITADDDIQQQPQSSKSKRLRGLITAKNRASRSSSGSSSNNVPLLQGSSSSLLALLPSGVGLQFNDNLQRYEVVAANNDESIAQSEKSNLFSLQPTESSSTASTRLIDPSFGPRGRSPIERQKTLDLNTFGRFALSGAICASAAHIVLTPLDVVKTKVQTDSEKYPNPIIAFQKLLKEDGPTVFFSGWVPTLFGFFTYGAVAYSVTEFFRRYFSSLVGDAAAATTLEVPIILASATVAGICASLVLSPSEAVRIRTVYDPNYAPNMGGVISRMIKEEGVSTLFSAVPAFLFKEIPFATAKFTSYTLFTQYLFSKFPAAQEDLTLSLYISLLGGTFGGICAAIVSNPADATISQMKKAKSSLGPFGAAKFLYDESGVQGFFKGLTIRFVFYALLISMQFFIFDAVRLALGIGPDDLKLYLNVLGGALKDSGGPV